MEPKLNWLTKNKVKLKRFYLILFMICLGCTQDNLRIVADLPYAVKEVSGMEMDKNNTIFWMVNDAGNAPILFSVNTEGNITHTVKVNTKNIDWEELTSDDDGNLYIGDFGNNRNDRKDLSILIVKNNQLKSDKPIDVGKISFNYPNQDQFPPKKDKRFYDCEAFFFLNDSLYLFTKSRVKDAYGKSTLFRLPAKPGHYVAEEITHFNTPCNRKTCWVTSADISPDKTQVALLTPTAILLYSDFEGHDFLNGNLTEFKFEFITQKESIYFKDNSTLYLADEYIFGFGGNLYEFKLK